MTSPLRRKRPTTPPSTHPATPEDPGVEPNAGRGGLLLDAVVDQPCSLPATAPTAWREPLWLPAGFLAALLCLTMALTAAGGEPAVEWRVVKVTSDSPSAIQAAFPVQQAKATNATGRAKGSSIRFLNRDHNIRQVGYDDPYGPELYAAPLGRAPVQGILEQDEEPLRVAQGEEPDFGAELEKQLGEPFGGEELPPQTEGVADPFSGDDVPEIDAGLPEMDSGMPEFDGGLPDGFDDLDSPELPVAPDIDNQSEGLTPIRDPYEGALGGDLEDEPSPRDDVEYEKRRAKERQEFLEDCQEEREELQAKVLSTLDISIGIAGVEGKDYPYNCSIDDGTPFEPRCWAHVVYMWKASALCHKPLYFEDKQLERYGHSWGPCLDPIMAGAHFFCRFPVLPYCMGLKAPNECVYTLGHYRPGSCAPYMIEPCPFTCRAAAFQAGFWTGGVFLVP